MALNFLNNGYFAGKVGIGTESPTAKLELGTNDFIMVNPGTGGRAGILFNETGTPSATNVQYGARISYAESGDVLELVMRENNVDKLGIAIARQTGYVGIGTDSPSEKLQVSGSGNESVEIKVSAGTTAGNTGSISLSRTDGSGNIIQGAAFLSGGVPIGGIAGGVVGSSNTSAPAFAIQTPNSTNGHIVFNPKGTEKMRILSDGNVGIDVTNPLAKLQVGLSTSNAGSTLAMFGAAVGGILSGLSLVNTLGNAVTGQGVALDFHVNSGYSPTGRIATVSESTTTPAALAFYTYNGGLIEKMRITSAGGISFGSTGTAYGTSGQILKSNGNASPTWIDGSAIPGVPGGSGTLNTIPLWTPDGDTLGDSHITQNTNDIFIPRYLGHTGDGNNYIGFPANDVFNITTAGNQRFRVNADGNIGIGTTSPGAKLHVAYSDSSVYSPTSPSGDLIISRHNTSSVDDQTVGIRFDTTGFAGTTTGQAAIQAIQPSNLSSADLAFLTRNNATFGERMRITSAGNVGIGTASPSEKLDVRDGTITSRDSGNVNYAELDRFAGLTLKGNGAGAKYISTPNTDDLGFKTNNAEKMRITSAGNVGIGTTSPTEKLHVDSIGTNYVARFRHSTGTGYAPGSILLEAGQSTSRGQGIFHYNNVSDENWFTGVPYSVASKKWIVANKYSTIQDVTTAQLTYALMTIDSDTGNVGIGTTSPSEKLDVAGNIKIQAALLSNQENTDVDTGAEVVAQVSTSTYTAAFFDFVIKKTTNVRSGTVYACHDGTNVEFTETSTQDLGDTSDVTLSVDISGGNMRLLATVTSDDWSVKSLIRAI